ncbi:LCP family protein [Streptococcus himalayensis]|uniref:Regulatory protein MsrR n=1 Tax=Streptococcus himalayensis TaxID=1888195 RepID=A0A917A7M1_9STRE|nr:LCP family protein [Streptococcus himalayensis]GGE33573.1 transcriptional regulator [Streptococcus himalayensis]
MSQKSTNLSRQEALRLQYLDENFHYLNKKERKEYDHLRRKERGEELSSSSLKANREQASKQTVDVNQKLPSYSRAEEHQTVNTQGFKLKRLIKWIAVGLVLVLLGMLFMFFKGLMGTTGDQQAAETEVFNGEDAADGVNILILGTDGRIGDSSTDTRTDSIMVLNVGGQDKKMKLVSFMRDTLVHIDDVSSDNEYDQKLNVAYTIGEQDNHQGAEWMRQTLKNHFGLNIKYYALVDFSTFATVVDTLFPNGVEMDARFSTVDGEEVEAVEVPDDLNRKDGLVPNQTISVGKQRMDGRTLLNYARFRKDDEGDFGRTRRQQEVLAAIFQQIKDPTKLFTGSEAAGKVFALTSTNIPYHFLLTNGLGVLGNAKNGIEKVTVPEYGDWEDAYDSYGGQGLLIDFERYQEKLTQLGLR